MDGEIVNNTSEDPIQREIGELDESNRKKEQTIRKMESRAAQNVNLYFIFQAVILASITSSSSLKCHHWWLPFTVSLLAAILNFFAAFNSMIKVLQSREELDQEALDVDFMKLYRLRKAQLNQVLPGNQFDQLQDVFQVSKQGNIETISRPKLGSFQLWKRRLLVYSSLAFFVGFSVVIMYGCYTLLCNSNGGKCVNLC